MTSDDIRSYLAFEKISKEHGISIVLDSSKITLVNHKNTAIGSFDTIKEAELFCFGFITGVQTCLLENHETSV
jgi:hypothetical protein